MQFKLLQSMSSDSVGT